LAGFVDTGFTDGDAEGLADGDAEGDAELPTVGEATGASGGDGRSEPSTATARITTKPPVATVRRAPDVSTPSR